MIKAVFFDMYNTLICYDPPREESQAKALKNFGFDIKPEALALPIIAGDEFFYEENARLPLAKRSEEERRKLWSKYEMIMLEEAGITPTKELLGLMLGEMKNFKYEMVLYKDVIPALTEIKKKGLVTGLISNVDKDITAMLEKLKIFSLLEIVITSQDAGFTKPHPEIFQAAIKKAEIDAKEAIYIGDQYKIDVLGANNAGMSGVLLDRMDYYKNNGIKEPRIRSLQQITELLS
ncbi:MAG: HAD family hydrolase [Dehalococcoidales bacterium]|nr:HAD family hydrolase [Dehalococcoidales bacterium]